MYRLYDFQCQTCDTVHEEMVDIPSGEKSHNTYAMQCPNCESEREHVRCAVNLIAKPTCDLAFSPRVAGGKFDTLGEAPMPKLPPAPKGASLADFKAHVSTPEYREIKKERRAIKKQNLQKRKRKYMMDRGENVSVRQNPLPGDPKF